MNRLKIIHILNSVGGVDVSLRLILENIDSTKFESIVIHGNNDTNTPYIDNLGNPVKDYKLPIQRDINLLRDFNAINKTLKIVKNEQPDLIHAHSAKGGVIAKIISTVLKIPVLHTPQAYSFLSANSFFKRKIFLGIEKLFIESNNKILASSPSEQNRAINEVGYPKDRVLLFNNSITPIKEISTLSINKTWPDNYICSVGRPSYQKNIELMLDVLNNLKNKDNNIHLVLMGVGFHSPNLEGIKQKIRELNLQKNITLLEWTIREDIFNIIKNSLLYISTARYEGLPYSVIESLALGKPIVATDADGNRDLIKENYNGYIIKNEDEKEFSNRIFNLIDNKEKLEKFSKNSIELFEKEFNMKNNIKNLETIYLENKKHIK